jgi:hypothetical protein
MNEYGKPDANVYNSTAKIVDDPYGKKPSPLESLTEEQKKDEMHGLTAWVMGRISQWRDHRRANYELQWDQYERLWRGIWAPEDKNRKSETSKLTTPAISEAVENIAAEVEEALWGRGDLFDIRPEHDDSKEMAMVTEKNKARLKEDLDRLDFRSGMGEALINGAVYGSGIAEIIVTEFKIRDIVLAAQEMMDGMGAAPAPMPQVPPQAPQMPLPGMEEGMVPGMEGEMPAEMPGEAPLGAPGAEQFAPQSGGMSPMPEMPPEMQVKVTKVKLASVQSINPRNFLIDPIARTIDSALGVAIEEYVGAHIVRAGQKTGDYRDVEVGTSAGDTLLAADPQLENEYVHDKVKIVRYYGLVPSHLLYPEDKTVNLFPETEEEGLVEELKAAAEAEGAAPAVKADAEDETGIASLGDEDEPKKSEDPIDSEMVEAIVVIANDCVCLKACSTPYLMEDRPVVAFPWDVVPGRFWGRGVPEKGQVPARALDAEMRARMDALAFTSAPMMGLDASKLPRGFQFTVKPGKSILTNGKPSDIMHPMHFGQLDQSTFQNSQQLDQMVQRATGSLDVISLAQRSGGDARPGAVSMMLSGIVKRHKRTLMNFVERFYVPALRKIMWRNMQFSPQRYTPVNWTFNAASTMGILQREYEMQGLTSLMQTMDPQSKEYKLLLMGVVANTGLTRRNEIMQMIEQSISNASAVENMQTKQQVDPVQQQLMAAQAQLQTKIAELQARANLQNAKAQNEMMEPEFKQVELATKGIYAVQADQQNQVFEQRLALVDRAIEMEDIRSNERIAEKQMKGSVVKEAVKSKAALSSEQVRALAERDTRLAEARTDERARAGEARLDARARAFAAREQARAKAAAARPKPQLFGSQAKVVDSLY